MSANKASFDERVKELASQALRDLKPVYDTISSYEIAENSGLANSADFMKVIERISGVMDPILIRVYDILQEYDKLRTFNIGTNLLHAGRGYALMVSQLTTQFNKKIHYIRLNNRVHEVYGYGELWKTLLMRFEVYYKEIKKILGE